MSKDNAKSKGQDRTKAAPVKESPKAEEAPKVDPLAETVKMIEAARAEIVKTLAPKLTAAHTAAVDFGTVAKEHESTRRDKYGKLAVTLAEAHAAGHAAGADWRDHCVTGVDASKVKESGLQNGFIKALGLVKATGFSSKVITQMIGVGNMLRGASLASEPVDVSGIAIPGMQNLPRCWRAKGGHVDGGQNPSVALRTLTADLQSGAIKAKTAEITKRAIELGIDVPAPKAKAVEGKENCKGCSYFGGILRKAIEADSAFVAGDVDALVKATANVAKVLGTDADTLALNVAKYLNGGNAKDTEEAADKVKALRADAEAKKAACAAASAAN